MKNQQKVLFLFYFYLLHFISANQMMLTSASSIKNTAVLRKAKSKTKGIDMAGMAKDCLKTLMDSVPPDFCWKKGADAGIIPTGCPTGYFRFLALCYENCSSGYYFVIGVCWSNCDSGYRDDGLTCYKSFFHWYFKYSYIPKSITNFSDRIPCPSGMYRFLALCYRDCNNIGLVNCGIGACAADSTTCASKLVGMVQSVVEGIATLISTVLTGGASAAVKAGLKTGLKALGKAALNAIKSRMIKLLTSVSKKAIINRAKSAIKSKVKDYAKAVATEAFLQTFCQGVWDDNIKKLSVGTPDVTEDSVLSSIDIFNVSGIVQDCKDNSSDAGLKCATTVVQSLSGLDPTGILTIAGAFMNPVCDVTTQDFRIDETINLVVVDPNPRKNETADQTATYNLLDSKDLTNNDKFDQSCIFLFNKTNLSGNMFKACNDQDLHSFNDITASFFVGINIRAILLCQHMSCAGRTLGFGGGTVINDLAKNSNSVVSLVDMVSAVKFGVDICYILNYRESMKTYLEGNNRFLCVLEVPNLNLTIRDDSKIDNKLITLSTSLQGAKITFYAGANYTGKSMEVKGSKTYQDRATFGFNVIGSYKIVRG